METTKILVVGKTAGEFYKNLIGGAPDFLENYTSLEVGRRLSPIYRLIYIESQEVYNDKKTLLSLWENLEYGGFMVVVRSSSNTGFYTPLEMENSNSIAEGAELSILEKIKNFE